MNNIIELLSRGKELREIGDVDNAIHIYHKILKIEQDNAKALYGLALCYYDKAKKEEEKVFFTVAFNNLLKVIKKEPEFSQAHNLLIDIAHRIGRLGDLSRIYNSLKEKEPENPMWAENLRKIQAISLLTIPEVSPEKSKKSSMGCFTKVFIEYSFPLSGIILVLLSKFYPEKFSFFLKPGVIILIFYLIFKFVVAIFTGKKLKDKW